MTRNEPHSRARAPDRVRSVTGTVTRVQSRHARVAFDNGQQTRCALRKTLFREEDQFTKPVAVGDRVRATVFGPRDAVVEEVLPRRGYLARLQAETGKEQILVANVDQVLITVALAEPSFRPRIADRILVAAERGGFDGIIALTKTDLIDDRGPFDEMACLWRGLGYHTLFTSTVTGEGMDELREILVGSTTVLAGQSGVGKSSLLNTIEPGLALRAQTVSDKWGKGRHTTTASELISLEVGGFVVDTPGIRSWGIVGLEPSDIAIFFRDLAPFVEACKYNECTHDHEPECAVKDAVGGGQIDERRYESYLRIIMGMEEED